MDTALATTRGLLVHAVLQGSPDLSRGVWVARRLSQSCFSDAAPHASVSFKAPLWVWAQEGKLHLDEVRKEAMGPNCVPIVALYKAGLWDTGVPQLGPASRHVAEDRQCSQSLTAWGTPVSWRAVALRV